MKLLEEIYDLEDKDTINYFDILNTDWSKFEYNFPFTEHFLDKEEVNKFYLVSQRYYNTVDFEEPLYYLNQLESPFELKVGTSIKVPDIRDWNTFQRKQQRFPAMVID